MDREAYRQLRQKGMPPGMARFALEELRHETLQGWMQDGVTRADYMQHVMMTDEEIESAFLTEWNRVLERVCGPEWWNLPRPRDLARSH